MNRFNTRVVPLLTAHTISSCAKARAQNKFHGKAVNRRRLTLPDAIIHSTCDQGSGI
ncbi:Uncharacterized protein DAT39_002851 [Clarias magur]|uniref:Lipoprotein n=1 Tax=Clarias magur TaxID=1594786 RepID=A0A8J4U8P3_CLAMG|nr:Uncharacterized protein DAT39_002851 [Clarias magur]